MAPQAQRQHAYQMWRPFGDEDYVEVCNAYGETREGRAGDMWWGYETECGVVGEGVIIKARKVEHPAMILDRDW